MAERCLDDLKREYAVLEKKYNLPSFKELNEEFVIERVQERETDALLREIRKVMMDKVITYLRFIETLLNPQNAPMFFYSLLKGIEATDKKILEETYTKLGKIEIEVVDVDNNYSEKAEADFIKHVFNEWKEIRKNVSKISKMLKDGWERKTKNKEKSYLG